MFEYHSPTLLTLHIPKNSNFVLTISNECERYCWRQRNNETKENQANRRLCRYFFSFPFFILSFCNVLFLSMSATNIRIYSLSGIENGLKDGTLEFSSACMTNEKRNRNERKKKKKKKKLNGKSRIGNVHRGKGK